MNVKNVILLILLFPFSIMFSQDEPDQEALDKMIIYELQDYKYRFFNGDTLRYRVESFDSIIINYDKPLQKTRFEFVEITCDSVSKDRRFLLSFRLANLISDESIGNEQRIRRTTSPWKSRKTYLWIDSLGNRLSSYADDSLMYAISPGGAFAPTLFFPIKETYRYINESWLVSSIDTLTENGVPSAYLNQSSLMRARNPLDTLDQECVRFSYIKTGNGAVNVLTNSQRIRTEVSIAGSGMMTISKKDAIPVHYFVNMEQKLKIFYPEQDEIPGQHFISSDWTLDTFIPSKARSEVPKSKKKSK